MKKTAVKPLNIIGIMLTLTGLLFPAVFIYGVFLIISGGYPEVPNLVPLAVIGGVGITAFVPFALTGLECRLNPAHSRAVDSPGRTVYFLCCMFFFISVFANILYSKAPGSDAKKSVKIILYSVSAVLLAVTAAVFVMTVMN